MGVIRLCIWCNLSSVYLLYIKKAHHFNLVMFVWCTQLQTGCQWFCLLCCNQKQAVKYKLVSFGKLFLLFLGNSLNFFQVNQVFVICNFPYLIPYTLVKNLAKKVSKADVFPVSVFRWYILVQRHHKNLFYKVMHFFKIQNILSFYANFIIPYSIRTSLTYQSNEQITN